MPGKNAKGEDSGFFLVAAMPLRPKGCTKVKFEDPGKGCSTLQL